MINDLITRTEKCLENLKELKGLQANCHTEHHQAIDDYYSLSRSEIELLAGSKEYVAIAKHLSDVGYYDHHD